MQDKYLIEDDKGEILCEYHFNPESWDETRLALKYNGIWDGEALTHSVERKEYGYLQLVNDFAFKFVKPEYAVDFDGLPRDLNEPALSVIDD